jgi:hypothetical protein
MLALVLIERLEAAVVFHGLHSGVVVAICKKNRVHGCVPAPASNTFLPDSAKQASIDGR